MAQEEGFFEGSRARRDDRLALRSLGAAQGRRRRPRRPGDHLRAGGGAGARKGPRRGRRRGARQPAADLADLAEGIGDQRRRRPERQDRLLRRDPLPGSLPEDDPARAPRCPPPTVKRSTSASACCPRWSTARPRRCSAATPTSRASTCANAAKNPVITPVDELGVPTYDELVFVARRSTLEEEGPKIRLFISALKRGTEAAVANPKAATEAILAANSSLEPKLDRSARSKRRCRCWATPRRASPTATWTRRSGKRSPAGCATKN